MQRAFQPLAGTLVVLLVCLGAYFGASSCSLDEALPKDWVLAKTTQQRIEETASDPDAVKKDFAAVMEAMFGKALQPNWPLGAASGQGAAVLVEAATVYRKECSHCHGLEGFGNGQSSHFVNPKPWNFAIGVFPRTAPDGGEPSLKAIADLLRTGIPSASMPAFDRLSKEKLMWLAGHVLLLQRRAKFEQALLTAFLKDGAEVLNETRARELYEALETKFAPAQR